MIRQQPMARVPAVVLSLGSPLLRTVCTPVAASELHSVAFAQETAQLTATLEAFRATHGFGRGIAAPQIGITKRFLALNLGDGPRVLINPTITRWSKDTFTMWDDCMCFPDLLVKVRRHASIEVAFSDEVGNVQVWQHLDRPTSELLQHEIDHLDGLLATDRALGQPHTMGANELLAAFPDVIIARDAFEANKPTFMAMVDYTI
ncbi:hypothetical protein SDRG_03528 [Saprolegnia diclina VS20]|uniref:Peptide deformylase n=1 Tax=Saprolegnia diclina (strain VS20) TaxID=1156394 RepID=T0S2S5_SAPDV|nr:hypothetical protein SDRG_03528 [Saprolegnia diclina VS20]EQC39323.1 hypothetical protein SDRG_03528 [Saprolegnia diclina VS20]|eukprot:XP_008607384.1 hypothetical protein SDRG_03528 [Saprolegnia diclina VS20]